MPLNESSPKTIAIVSHFGWGMVQYRLGLLRALVGDGWDVLAIADWSDGDYESRVQAEGVRTAHMKLTRSRYDIFGDVRTVVQLVRLYRKFRPRVVQHFHTRPMLLGAVAARIAGVPKIVNCVTGRGILFSGRMESVRRLLIPLYRMAFGGRVAAIFQHRADLEYMIAAGVVDTSRSFLVSGSGIDTEALKPDFARPAADRALIVMASRMMWSKGVREFVGAARILKPRFPHIRFVLAGGLSGTYGMNNPDDVDEAWLREASSMGEVEWLGHQDGEVLANLYRRAAAVVLPSVYPEGIPRSLIEGAAAGAPVVTTDMPGCRETVVPGVSGYLCEPRSCEKLADAIAAILSVPGAIEAMGQESRRLAVERFDIRKISAAFLDIYAEP